MSKEDLSKQLNELLGLEENVDFSKMSKEDLEKLLKVLDATYLIQTGIKSLRSKARKEVLDKPLKDLLDKPIFEMLEGRQGKGGPLGLGILDRIRGRD